jgi:hypothetical protein
MHATQRPGPHPDLPTANTPTARDLEPPTGELVLKSGLPVIPEEPQLSPWAILEGRQGLKTGQRLKAEAATHRPHTHVLRMRPRRITIKLVHRTMLADRLPMGLNHNNLHCI